LPQDGSFRSHVIRDGEKTDIDFRVSVVPSHYGENIVIRILDSQRAPSTIDHLDFSETLTKNLTRLFKQNTGIILITGPTGSGKSTTLQSGLLTAYRPGLKVVTAEDPIEYIYDNFMQCEINEKIGLTFASYIRVFLRHDPEIIMIGEIRDSETAEMAIRAAQTGHLVLSTLHTNDSLGAISRLSGLGINPSMISSSLIGVISQRLARKICPQCAESYTPDQSLISEFFTTPPTDINWQKGIGCEECNYTGYKGRVAIAELWEPSQHDILLINKQVPLEELKLSTRKSTIPLIQEALQKLREGITSLDELIRIIPYAYIEDHRKQQAVKG
ncbi:MAG: type II/IV secretion system protein, partial [Deltaproteobacteria bacterium]|nr:type II/IV secretion system protein [Candidatus Tharpella sp.]